MEILIQLAGVQLGPYSEEQVRQHLSEGLLSLTDPAKQEGMEDWVPLSDVLAKMHPMTATQPVDVSRVKSPMTDTPSAEAAPKRAPDAPPGVMHLPVRNQDSNQVSPPSLASALAKKTILIGPTAPDTLSPSGKTAFSAASSTVTTSPLVPANQSTKKVSRASLVKALAQKTSPLPTKAIAPPSKPPSGPVSAVPEPPPPTEQEPKKATLPSLMRALTAKTVPMRSAPASPPAPPLSPATPLFTAPMPTKPVFKPASGTVPPPPSVVNALTKKMGRASLSEEQTSPPTLGLGEEVKTTRIPPPKPPKSKTAEPPAEPAPAPDEPVPVDEPSDPPAPRRIMPILICACAVVALLAPYYVWSPYHAASSLRNAVNDGDPAGLNAAIDFPSVRASLKEQIKNQLTQSGLQDAPSHSSAGSASSTVLSMIDHSIDVYVTPEGISALVNKSDSFANEDQSQLISSEEAAKILLTFTGQPVNNQGLASLDDFVLDWNAAMLHLQFQGLGWKLKRVVLRPDLGLPASPGTAAPLISPVVDTYLEWGSAKSKNGDWNGAIAAFTQVLAIDPHSSVAYNDRGAARESKGDLDGAIKDFTQALTLDPQMAAAYASRGNAKAAKNDLDGAIADYTQAVQLDPTLAAAYDSRGNVKIAKNDLDGAIADFTQAITIDPNLASAYSDRGFARQANGNLDGAISDYTQALALKPKTAIAYYNRGLARQSQGNLEEAIVDFDRALAFDPKIAGAYFSRGNAKNATHDLDGAIADYTQAIALNPKQALAYSNRGQARQAKGDLGGAVADYTLALAVDPKIAIAYFNRGLIEAQKNDFDDAIADTTQALYLDPKNALAYYTRGLAKLTEGNLDGAADDLKAFNDLAPKDHNADPARLYLWLIAKTENSKTDADQDLSDALENSWNSSPDDLVSKTAEFLLGRMNEADYLAAAGSTDAKPDQDQRCEAWYFAGMKRLLTGDKKGAIDAFHQCVATGQKDVTEYALAQGELQTLESTPAPAPVALPVTPPAKSP